MVFVAKAVRLLMMTSMIPLSMIACSLTVDVMPHRGPVSPAAGARGMPLPLTVALLVVSAKDTVYLPVGPPPSTVTPNVGTISVAVILLVETVFSSPLLLFMKSSDSSKDATTSAKADPTTETLS